MNGVALNRVLIGPRLRIWISPRSETTRVKMNMKLTTCFAFVVLLFSWMAADADADWGDAQWIGYSQDDRPEAWSVRKATFNQPPHDISSWKPTAKELQSTPRKSFASPLLRTTFEAKKSIKSATISVCGLGLYELWLNGEKVGKDVLQPAQTSYDKRAFYNVYDVTDQIRQNANAVGLMLGNGFHGQNVAFGPNLSYGPPRALLRLIIRYRDGSQERVVSDKSWRASGGPVLFDNIYFGETFDARRLPANWSQASFDDSKWSPVEQMQAPGGQLVEQQMEHMRKVRQIKPAAILPAENGWIVDMGENITGWLNIDVQESAGTEITLRFAEHLMPDRQNIDTASTGIHATGGEQQDIYLCRGGAKERWEPRFTYHGFRYVQIEGLSRKPTVDDLTGWLVRTDVKRIGRFECSNPLINKFYEVSLRTIETNMQGLLSDCPHRERCAWMGDIHAVGEMASYNYDLRKFWPKTARDIETMLGAGGGNPSAGLPNDPRAPCNIAVGNRKCGQARPDWGAATVLVPWFAYLHYGDLELVREAWPMMEGWMEYLNQFAQKDGIIDDGFGDWCPPGSNSQMDTPSALTSTALYYQTLTSMQIMAEALGQSQQAKLFGERANDVKQAFNDRFFTSTSIGVEPSSRASEVEILQADFGVGTQRMDLKDKLSELVADGQYQFEITIHFAGKDPAPGKKKNLHLVYTINGQRQEQTIAENQQVNLFRRTVASYGSQSGSAFALHTGIVPQDKRQAVADGLAALVMDKSGGHYTTGIFGHRPLYTQLNDYGHGNVTRHLWRITDWPSLGFMTEKHDLTTWPEVPFNWPQERRYRRNSFNHPMHSGFAATFHESIGGIRPDPSQPGYRRVVLRPTFIPDLEWAKAEYESPQGLISSRWKREAGRVVWNVSIPAGSTAQIELPLFDSDQIKSNGKPVTKNQFELASGDWTIELE